MRHPAPLAVRGFIPQTPLTDPPSATDLSPTLPWPGTWAAPFRPRAAPFWTLAAPLMLARMKKEGAREG